MSLILKLWVFLLLPAASFAAINASQTMVIQTGATERARINTNGIETTRVSATYISTTLVQASGTPTANNHLATKAYVDAAVAAAGGGRPTYMGVTSSSYNGGFGNTQNGIHRGHALCNAQYAGSRMMLSEDIAITDYTTPVSTTGWVHCSSFAYTSQWFCNGFISANLGNNPNCYNSSPQTDWSSTSASDKGMTLSSSFAAVSAACNSSLPIHCVKD